MAWFLGWMMDEGECGLVVECVTDDGDEFDESGYKNEHGVFPWWVVSFGDGIFINTSAVIRGVLLQMQGS